MRLSHLGPRGTYTEEAAGLHAPDADLFPYPTVRTAIDAVIDGSSDAAVCALENSIEGSVSIETLDLLLNPDFPLVVAGEVVVTIRHALVGRDDSDPAAATRVYSHPQALAQCRHHLAELVPGAEPIAALSTAGAIESAMAEPGALAVGNERAAALYGARIHVRDIGDEADNETRFVVLQHEDGAPTGDDKTSLAFTTQHDRPGSLVEVLLHFARRGLNMTRIESRPTRRQLGTYVFLVDIQGHRADQVVREAIAEAEEMTSWFRVLGSYPRWQR